MNEKQQQLQFEKGITNVPSDLLCSDNTLEESVGMIYENSEHRVIQKPAVFVDTETPIVPILEGFHLLYVHKFNNEERYIGYTFDDSLGHHANYLCYSTKSGTTLTFRELPVRYTDSTKVTSVGKTLIVSDEDGVHYLLWKNTPVAGILTPDYEDLGDIPDPKLNFWMVSEDKPFPWGSSGETIGQFTYCSGMATGMVIPRETTPRCFNVTQHEDYNNLILGLYYKNLKEIASRNKFCRPFYIRTALKMYDGSYTRISQPVLMLPSLTENTIGVFYRAFGTDENYSEVFMLTQYAELHYRQPEANIDKWSDIVKNITVFVSEGIDPHNTGADQFPNSEEIALPVTCKVDGVYWTDPSSDRSEYIENEATYDWHADGYFSFTYHPLKKKDQKDLLNDLKSASRFYKLCDVGIRANTSENADTSMSPHIQLGTLENLSTQEQLEVDDWFSRSILYPQYIYAYNSRLNLASVARSMFEGFDFFMPFDNASESTYDFYVRIETDADRIWVHHQKTTKQKQGIYFYYPDSRADRVTIYKTSGGTTTCVCDRELTEHSGLNGAYYLRGLPGAVITDETTDPVSSIDGFNPSTMQPDNSYREILPNYIITSEVNNPWVFKAEGYNKVGTGKIIGMSTITQALSQGQFGQYPLLVFSESGIWAMSVDNTGLFKDIHPMSREVCNNAGSITQTDGAVFFTSEKGLMVVVGSEVKCVSEQLSGLETNFTGEIAMGNIRDYMKDCFIAYDYRDSLLWIFNNSRTHVVSGQTVPFNTDYCYVYAIKSGTFGKYRFANAITNVVNNYPDYLLQSGSTLFSLTGRQNINLDTDPYSGLMITRPMKLENGLALKSLMQIKNLRQFSSGATLQLTLYASNDCEHWVQIPSLRGTPFKYWRFRFDFAQMKATDRYAGTIVITQERRIDKLR